MCFNLSLLATTDELERRYKAKLNDPDRKPVHHISGFEFPEWPVITPNLPQQFQTMRWGLVPRWAKSTTEALELRNNTLNARVETLSEKPSFKYALAASQRCLIPATGFFEWQTAHKHKYPYFIHLPDQPIFSMAGLWETWQNPTKSDEIWHTFSIVTTEANPLMARIHNTKQRMPFILKKEAEHNWLAGIALENIASLIVPEQEMSAYTIGRLIGQKAANTNVPAVLQPFNYPELSQQQLSLF